MINNNTNNERANEQIALFREEKHAEMQQQFFHATMVATKRARSMPSPIFHWFALDCNGVSYVFVMLTTATAAKFILTTNKKKIEEQSFSSIFSRFNIFTFDGAQCKDNNKPNMPKQKSE